MSSVVNPDPYWIAIQKLCGSGFYSEYGSGSTHINNIYVQLRDIMHL